MTDLITIAEQDIAAGWKWVKTEAADIYNAIRPLVTTALSTFESVVVNNLWGAAASFITQILASNPLSSPKTLLTDLETAFLNTLEHLWPNLLSAATALGSVLLQSLLGIFHAKQTQAA